MSCAATSCSSSLLTFSFPPADSAPALPAVTVLVVAHPLMSKLLIYALPRLSAVCCLGCLSRLVLGPLPCLVLSSLPMAVISTLACFCLDLPCTSKPIPSPSPLKIMTGCCDDVLLSCAAPYLLATPCPCPVPIGDCPPVRCL